MKKLLFLMLFFALIPFYTVYGLPDQNIFINEKTGSVISFDKFTSPEKISTIKNVLTLAYTDSLQFQKNPFIPITLWPPDYLQTFSHVVYFQNYKYFSSTSSLSAKFEKGEIYGFQKEIFKLSAWKQHKNFPKENISLVTWDLYQTQSIPKKEINNPLKIIHLTPKMYNHFNKLFAQNQTQKEFIIDPINEPQLTTDSEYMLIQLLKQSSQPVTEDIKLALHSIDSTIKAKLPIICIDPDSHFQRLDKNDWKVNSFLNNQNGDFYLYISFEKLKTYSMFFSSRNFALDYLAGVNDCRQSVVGVILEPGKRMVIKHEDIKMSSPLIFALDKNGKIWKPNSPPADKNTIPNDRLQFILNPYILFGSWCPIWELNIWRRAGMMLKKHPEGIYLVGYGTLLQAEETQTVEEEHAFIQKHGVLITPELYTALEYLRKSQKDTSCLW